MHAKGGLGAEGGAMMQRNVASVLHTLQLHSS